jgi:hypothetical protein
MPRTKRIASNPKALRKGNKTARGQPAFYSEKKQRVNLTLTPTATKELEKSAQALNLSISEFVERIGRGIIPVLSEKSVEPERNRAKRIARRIAEMLEERQLAHICPVCAVLKLMKNSNLRLHALLSPDCVSVLTFPSSEKRSGFEELVLKMAAVLEVDTCHYKPAVDYYLNPDGALTTEIGKPGQRPSVSSENLLTTSENLLTTQQAWEVAKSRGYKKSKVTFRAWSRQWPEKCRECHGLSVISDPQKGQLIGYRDDQTVEDVVK